MWRQRLYNALCFLSCPYALLCKHARQTKSNHYRTLLSRQLRKKVSSSVGDPLDECKYSLQMAISACDTPASIVADSRHATSVFQPADAYLPAAKVIVGGLPCRRRTELKLMSLIQLQDTLLPEHRAASFSTYFLFD